MCIMSMEAKAGTEAVEDLCFQASFQLPFPSAQGWDCLSAAHLALLLIHFIPALQLSLAEPPWSWHLTF